MSTYNEMKLEFSSYSENESFARTVVSAFIARMDPTLEELADVKTAVSEAVTNAIIHGYEKNPGKVTIYGKIEGNTVYLEISDEGEGICDISKAMNRSIHPSRNWTGLVWALHLWRHLWTSFMWSQSRGRERLSK